MVVLRLFANITFLSLVFLWTFQVANAEQDRLPLESSYSEAIASVAALPSPTHHWTFDEGIGTIAADTGTTGGVNGALLNGASWTAGVDGDALLLGATDATSTDDYVDLGTGVPLSTSMTIAMWVRLDVNSTTDSAMILDGPVSDRLSLDAERNADGDVVTIGYGPNGFDTTTSVLPLGEWTHLVLARQGANLDFYVNGTLEDTFSFPASVGRQFASIGDDDDGTITSIIGAIDDVIVYDGTKLDATQVQELYDSYSIDSIPEPNHHWTFDENGGNIANDTGTDTALPGTLTGSATWTTGVSGEAVLLTASDGPGIGNDAVDISGTDTANAPWTLSMWLRRDEASLSADVRIIDGTFTDILSEIDGTDNTGIHRLLASNGDFGYQFPIGEWIHFVWVADDSQIVGYANGVAVGTIGFSVAQEIRSFGNSGLGSDSSFIGAIDDVRRYDEDAFTAAQVQELYDSYGQGIHHDYGDLPDVDSSSGSAVTSPNYNTNSTGTVGASHIITPGLYLGAVVDDELEGQPSADSTADDVNGTINDEDGVSFSPLTAGETATITATVFNTTALDAILYAFIDWNGDGGFVGFEETISTTVPSGSFTTVVFDVDVPANADTSQQLGARFRLSSDVGLGPDGPASDGEVEDYLVSVAPPPLSIGDFVWDDLNQNGIQDGNEPGIDGVTVKLYNVAGSLIDSTSTAFDGSYSFTNLADGFYYVQVDVPTGYGITTPDLGGDDALDSDLDGLARTITFQILPGTGNNNTWDAGLFSTGPTKATVKGYVFDDADGDAFFDLIEVGIVGVSIDLIDASSPNNWTTVTTVDGSYIFTDVTPGIYTVQEIDPIGYASTTDNLVIITATAGTTTTVDFGDLFLADLVINEIDYNQPGADSADLIELRNNETISITLDNHVVQFINGTGPADYANIDLSGHVIEPGSYLVLCSDNTAVANCDIEFSASLQNGPDAVALLYHGVIVDTVSYDGDVPGYTEGTSTQPDPDTEFTGLSRLPDGTDTDDNNSDFAPACITPGEANTTQNTNCGPPDVMLAVSPLVTEGEQIVITATLDITSSQDITVSLHFTDIATTAGVDYAATAPAEIIVPAGSISAWILFDAVDDSDVEGDESFEVTIGAVDGAIDISTPQTVTIIDNDQPTVDLSVNPDVLEGDMGTITATLDVSATWDITVTLAFTDDTATSGGIDYTEPAPAEIVIPAGDLSASISFTTIDDVIVEGDETFDVSIVDAVSAIDFSSPQTVTILDNDQPTVDLTVSSSVTEGQSIEVRTTLDVTYTDNVTVTIVFTDNTAIDGIDYLVGGAVSVVIPAGANGIGFFINTVDDVNIEGDETFEVGIFQSIGATYSTASQTVTIIDNDEPNVDLVTSPDVQEGSTGAITATLDVSVTWDVTVTLAFTDSTAISGGIDYTEPTPAEIVIPAGDVSASISVTTVDDVDVEGDETFDVAIASVDGAIDVSSPQTVTIIDNDEPIVDLSASLSVLEGDTAAITATLDVSVTWEVTVTLIFSDNTATGGIDYTEPTPAEIIIPAGDMSASISVTTVDDVDVEGDETFDVSIDNAEGAIDVSAPQTVTIIDNDEPNVDLSASLDVLEGESGSITATLDVSVTWDVTVTLAFTDDTATGGGTDYTESTPAEIVIPAGDVSASITFPTVDDALVEGDETFSLFVATVEGATDVSTLQTVAIIDNDEPNVDLAASANVLEGESGAITATLDVSVTWDVSVTLDVTNVTATGGGIDYSDPNPATIIIPAGFLNASSVFDAVDDTDIEGDESFDVAIDSALGAIDISVPQMVTIIDNDEPNVDLSASPSVLEGESGSITATLDVSVTWDISVTLTFTDDTALGSSDYVNPVPTEILIPAGELNASALFDAVDDDDIEGDETFIVAIESAVGATPVISPLVVTILDNDEPTVDLAATPALFEGESGAITATLDVSVTWDVSVTLAVTDVTATGGGVDFTDPNPATISIPAGALSASSVFDAIDDPDIEGDESFDVMIESTGGAIDTSSPLMVLILDNDEPAVDLAVTPVLVEGEIGAITATLDVSVTWDVSITLTFTEITASDGADYISPSPAEIFIPAGDLSANIPLGTVDDSLVEIDESLEVGVGEAYGAINVSSSSTVILLDNDEPTVDLAASLDVLEGDTGFITATLDITAPWDITVTLTLTDDTATGGGIDYSDPNPATIIIPAGSLSASSVFDAIDDSDVEGDESFDIAIASADGAIDVSSPQGITIVDNDEPYVDLSVTTDVVEGDSGTITATLDVSVTWDVTVTLAFTDDTATGGGTDYTEPIPAEIVIPSGDVSGSLSFSTIDDTDVEGDETFDIAIASAFGANDISTLQTVTILNDDEPNVVLAVTPSLLEGGTGFITATLDVASNQDVTVTLTFTDATAANGVDYSTATPAQIVIPAGFISAWASFNAFDDSQVEGDESFEVAIGSALGAIDISIPQTVTIIDNDEPTVALSTNSPVNEGTDATLTVTLNTASFQTITVSLLFSNGTATGSGIDYTEPAPAEIVIPAGDVSASITLPTVDDTDVEGNETFDASIASADGAIDVSTSQTVTIVDNDEPTVTLSTNSPVDEGMDVTLTAALDTASFQTVTVSLLFSNGTATGSGIDYTQPAIPEIIIPAGDLTGTAIVPTNDDGLVEDDETFDVSIASVSNAVDGSTPQTVTIVNNDQPTVVLGVSSPITEGNSATVTATLDILSNQNVTITLVFNDGSATGSSVDYSEPTVLDIVVPVGSLSGSTTVSTTNDLLAEGRETFEVGIASVVNAANGSSTQTIQIVDNDVAGVSLIDVNDGDTLLVDGDITVDEATSSIADRFGVFLDAQPATSNVVVAMSTDGQCEVSPSTLTFTTNNFDTQQTVDVTAVDDVIDEIKTHTCEIRLRYSGEPAYAALPEDILTAVVSDNDLLGVRLTDPNNGDVALATGAVAIDEANATPDQFSLSLAAKPASGDVIVTVSSDAQCTATPSSLTFSTITFDVPQTVSTVAVDDALDESSTHICTVTLNYATSIDSAYAVLIDSTVSVLVTDNDSSEILLTDPNDGNITLASDSLMVVEAGSTSDRFGLSLQAQPVSGNAIVDVTTDGQCHATPTSLTFAANNFDVTQIVTVTAIDDAIDEANPHGCSVTLSYGNSSDTTYASLAETVLNVAVSDNDSSGVSLLDPNNGDAALTDGAVAVDEATSTIADQFSVVLDSAPLAGNVQVALSSDSQCIVTPTALEFSAAMASTPQAVSVTAIDDMDSEATPHTCLITLDYSGSIDTIYAGLSSGSVRVAINDDDDIGISLLDPNNSNAPLGNVALVVDEATTAADQFAIVLMSAPTAGNASVAIATNGQCSVTPSALTFTAANATTAQVVDVVAIDDSDVEPNPHDCVLNLNYSSSTDATYAAFTNDIVNVLVSDDDETQVSNSLANPSSLLFIAQAGAANPPSQQVAFQYPGGSVGWSFSSWVSTSTSWGANSTLLMDVSVDVQGRREGTYQGTLVVTLGSEQVTVPIELRVVSQTELLVNRSELVFGGTQGEPAPSVQTVNVHSNDLSLLTWTASADQSWISLSSTSGTTPADLFVGIADAKMNDVGTHNAVITISDGTTTHSIAVQLNVIAAGANSIELTGLEVTQGVQNLLNAMPVVENRATFVRAHVRSRTGDAFSGVTAKLSGTRGGATVGELTPANGGGTINVIASPDRGQLNDSFLFELPPSWRTGDVVLTFSGVSHPIDCAESAGTPNDCQAAVTFEAVPDFPIHFINGSDTVSGYQFTTRAEDQLGTIKSIEAFLPVDVVNWAVSPTTLHYSGIRNNSEVLNDVRAIWTNDGSPQTHYYGLFAKYSASGAPQVNSISGIASLGGFMGMGDYTTWGESLNVHELGHNLGIGHAPCGTTSGLDPNFPYADARTSQVLTGDSAYYGFHIYNQTIYPPTTKDVMSYCSQKWIADWTYREALNVIKTKYVTTEAASSDLLAQAGERVIIIQGMVDPDSPSGTIDSVIHTMAQSDIVQPDIGANTLRLEDSQGNLLAGYQLPSQEQLDHSFNTISDTEQGYNLIVPYPEELSRLVLLHHGQVLDTREASANSPTIRLISPVDGSTLDGDTVVFEWQAEDTDGDELTYNVEYSNDNGQSWHELAMHWKENQLTVDTDSLPGGEQSMVRVVANDGVHGAFAQTQSSFSVPNHAPNALILAPATNRLYVGAQQIILEGTAHDQEDGRLTGEALVWRSDRNGVLGTGETLVLMADDLAEGQHTITLEATDSGGLISTRSTVPTSSIPNENDQEEDVEAIAIVNAIHIEVSRDRFTLPTTLAVAPAGLDFVATIGGETTQSTTISIRNSGEGTMQWSISDSANRLRTTKLIGEDQVDLEVMVDIPQEVGIHTGILRIESPDAVNGFVEVPYSIFVSQPFFENSLFLPLAR